MNNTYIIGCAYGTLNALSKEIYKHDTDANVIHTNDIVGMDYDNFYIGKKNRLVDIKSIVSSFIRYPYDLISPHSLTYALWEKTEFLKTVSIMLTNVAINPFIDSYIARNRAYVLTQARDVGLETPERLITERRDLIETSASESLTAKSLGNCFISENIEDADGLVSFVKEAKDGNDTAYVFPAQPMTITTVSQYLEHMPVVYLQSTVNAHEEFRVYVIGGNVMYYQREKIEVFDKSEADYLKPTIKLPSYIKDKLRQLATILHLRYLCVDLILKKDGGFIVVYVNPFGKMPVYPIHPKVTEELAKLMIRTK